MLQELSPYGRLFDNSPESDFCITWRKPLFGMVWRSAWMISSLREPQGREPVEPATHLCRIGVNGQIAPSNLRLVEFSYATADVSSHLLWDRI